MGNYHGKKSYNRQRVQSHSDLCPAVSALLLLQTLYGMADLYITGRFCGVDSITAVANGSQVMHMLTVIIVGLAMGSTVIIGHAVGAGNMRDAEAAIGNTVTLFMAVSLGFTAVLVAAVRPLVGLIGVPAEAVPGTVQYLTICFIGIPFITAYNIISSIFRGLGDSKSPMYFIAVACAANIALDILFIGPMALGPVGAALGTTLSQTLSVIVALFGIRRHKTGLRLSRQNFRPRKGVLGRILKIGLPAAVQDGCIQVAFIIITIIANHRGLIDSAAVGIVEKSSAPCSLCRPPCWRRYRRCLPRTLAQASRSAPPRP